MTSAALTSPAVERAVAALLGADDDSARAAVAALASANRLGEGLALLALLHAARSGTDAAGAVRDLAAGAALPAEWSDYERRVAAEELGDEVRLPAVGRGAERLVVAAGQDAPLRVVRALADGATVVATSAELAVTADGLAPPRARCDHEFIARLARHCGARLLPRTTGVDAPRTPGRTALDETVPRSEDYLDALYTR